jgi:hypothetical protein
MVRIEGSPMPMSMVKIDNAWKVSMDAMMGGTQGRQMLAMTKRPLESIGAAFEKVTARIGEGGYANAEAMLLDLNKEMMIAMQRAAPGGAGGDDDGGGK